jgi:hypothetical protein
MSNNVKNIDSLVDELDVIVEDFVVKLNEIKVRRGKIIDVIDARLKDKQVASILDKIKHIE